MRARAATAVMVTLALLAAASRAHPPPPPPPVPVVARSATTIATAVLRAGAVASAGARAPGAALIAIRPRSAVLAGATKVVFGDVSMTQVEFAVQDKRPRRVEVLGLGGGSFVLVAPPRRTVAVAVPPGFGPPLAMRIEPASPLPEASTLFR